MKRISFFRTHKITFQQERIVPSRRFANETLKRVFPLEINRFSLLYKYIIQQPALFVFLR